MDFPAPGETQSFDIDEFAKLPWIGIGIGTVLLFVASVATSAIWLAATSYGTFQYLRGQPVRMWQCLRRGVAVVLPCIGFMFIISIGAIVIGSILITPVFATIDDYESTESILGFFLWLFLAGFVLFIIYAIIGLRLW
jgi:hypothetical protein